MNRVSEISKKRALTRIVSALFLCGDESFLVLWG